MLLHHTEGYARPGAFYVIISTDQSFTTECGVSVLSAKSSYQPAVLSTDYHSSASVENTLSVLQTVLANRRKKEGRPNEVEVRS